MYFQPHKVPGLKLEDNKGLGSLSTSLTGNRPGNPIKHPH